MCCNSNKMEPGSQVFPHLLKLGHTHMQNNPLCFYLANLQLAGMSLCPPPLRGKGSGKVSIGPVLHTLSFPSIWPLFRFYYTRITISRSATPSMEFAIFFSNGLCWCSEFPFSACIFNWVLSQWCGNDLFFALCSLDSSSESVTLIKTFTLISQRTPFFVH